jgi:GTPase SAR1 family protein
MVYVHFKIFKFKAGQERYRSITKQYFRKADGVICMYDVTSEQSFKNMRNWITSIKVFFQLILIWPN